MSQDRGNWLSIKAHAFSSTVEFCWKVAVQSVITLPRLLWVVYMWSHVSFSSIWVEAIHASFESRVFKEQVPLHVLFLFPCLGQDHVWHSRHGEVVRWNNLVSGTIALGLATLDYCEQDISFFHVGTIIYLGIYLLPQLTLSWLTQCWWTKPVLAEKVCKILLVHDNLRIEIESKNLRNV